MTRVGVGLIGGGLMGRELASALGRWFALEPFPVRLELVAVCEPVTARREWFGRVPTVRLLTADHQQLLRQPDVDVVYAAVPHQWHERIYIDVLEAGKDLLGEKPFGIDLRAARAIADAARATGRFVRCSSEFPFLPAALRVFEIARAGRLGEALEVRCGFLHSGDLDRSRPINWKRQVETCGEIGVMGDLGMHVLHLPLALGWRPHRLYAQLQKIVDERPDGRGGTARCDTWDNATLHTDALVGGREVPMRLEMKRIAPGETNTWFVEVIGTEGGAKYSTKEPKTLWTFRRDGDQLWCRTELGHQMAFPTVTGGIFEAGFPDCFLQMCAAFAAERAGMLGDRLRCVTPEDAVLSHQVFAAALRSHARRQVVEIPAREQDRHGIALDAAVEGGR